LNIIGKCDIDINKYFKNIPPVNVNLFGYIEEYSECLRMSDAFVNLSYRDPAPKVVCQAVNCGLPILYANSGGTPDLVKYGIGIKDPCDFVFEEKTPSLKPENILKSYCKFIECYGDIFYAAQNVNRNSYMNMLSEYFAVIKRCA
jgi:glycosyltransferase involved in cell wall biosynthesis